MKFSKIVRAKISTLKVHACRINKINASSETRNEYKRYFNERVLQVQNGSFLIYFYSNKLSILFWKLTEYLHI